MSPKTHSGFHENLRLLVGREKSQWARKLKTSRETIENGWEKGSFPKTNNLIQILKVSGVEPGWLLLNNGLPFSNLKNITEEKLLRLALLYGVYLGFDWHLNLAGWLEVEEGSISNWIEADQCRHIVFFGHQRNEFHHRNRSNGHRLLNPTLFQHFL